MTATVDLSEQELAELRALTQETDAAAALRAALQQYVRYAKRMRLKTIAGRASIEENWQELEERELRKQNGSCDPGAG